MCVDTMDASPPVKRGILTRRRADFQRLRRVPEGVVRFEALADGAGAGDIRAMTVEFGPPEGITLRPARKADYAFAEALYLSSTRPLLTALGAWDEEGARTRLRAAFDRHPPLVICADGKKVGWVQVSVRPGAMHLHQIHLSEACRNRGIGTGLIGDIMRAARQADLPVTLNVIRGNPAVGLYERMNFVVVNRGRELLQMRWQADGLAAPAAPEPPAS